MLSKSSSLPMIPGYRPCHPLPHKGRKAKPMKFAYHLNTMFDFGNPKYDPVVDPAESAAMMSTMKKPDWRMTDEQKNTTFEKFTEDELRNWRRENAVPSEGPAWLKHDKQVCRFFAYTQDSVTESVIENSRVRYVTILFFLEDGTMQIGEHKTENSGLWQGAMVKRHCIMNPDETAYLGLDDLKCGQNIEIYARVYHIVGCDAFTRWYYQQNGIEVGEEEGVPTDSYTKRLQILKEKADGPAPKEVVEGQIYNEKAVGGNRNTNLKLEQFLENDLRVLRFFCFWDDTTTYGIRFYYVLSYFLAENKIQIAECNIRNSGRDPYPVFFKKGPMIKKPNLKITPGMLEPSPDYYKPEDLLCGKSINVYGRELVFYDVDPFTREFYKKWMGVEQKKFEVPPVVEKRIEMPIPPHVGVGDPDDSIGSCLALWPKARKVDQKKLMTKSGMVMRFEAKFDKPVYPEDVDRKFILAYSLADDELAVYEMKRRNSGFMEGKFSEKSKKRDPATGLHFTPADFFVGNVIKICTVPFRVLRPDEYTLAYMEANPESFPYSDLAAIMPKLKELITEEKTVYTPDELMASGKFVDHEVITLLRKFGTQGELALDLSTIVN